MKDTFYFSHDYNARNDDKILAIRSKYGNEGYALYFYCIETMAERGDGYIIPSLIGGLELGYGVANGVLEKFLAFCEEINLLKRDDKGFYSPRMIEHLRDREYFRTKGIEGAKKRWGESQKNSPPNSKERKEKENNIYIGNSKEEEEIISYWNELKKDSASVNTSVLKGIPMMRRCVKVTPTIHKKLQEAIRQYGVEEIKRGIMNYAKDICGRKPTEENDYYKHRFSFFEFIGQKNGVEKFISL